jgi:hypothetical protein
MEVIFFYISGGDWILGIVFEKRRYILNGVKGYEIGIVRYLPMMLNAGPVKQA